MKKIIITGIIAVFALLSPQILEAQGTITYLSYLGQPSTGSFAVGSDSWLAAGFVTGANAGGYVLNSVQLAMTDASGSPSGISVMLYSQVTPVTGPDPGSSLGSLSGSASPTTAGTYTYAASANLTLSPDTIYWLVLTSGTTVANGAYEWSTTSTFPPSLSGGWGAMGDLSSNNGLGWSGAGTLGQFALNATAVPEPGVTGLLGLGGLLFGLGRWKKNG